MSNTICFNETVLPPAVLAGSVPTSFAVDVDGNPIQFFYDLPCFVGDNFAGAAEGIDYWAGQHARDVQEELDLAEADQANAPGSLCSDANRLKDLGMVRPSHSLAIAENLTLDAAVRDALTHCVTEVCGLATSDQGHYLAQALTRWFTNGDLGWIRFKIGHLLATYFSTMPTTGRCLGLVDVATESGELTVVVWCTDYGVYLDLVHIFRPDEDYLVPEVEAVIAVGRQEFASAFAGVRYLPLDGLNDARLYDPEMTWEPVVERNVLHWLELAIAQGH